MGGGSSKAKPSAARGKDTTTETATSSETDGSEYDSSEYRSDYQSSATARGRGTEDVAAFGEVSVGTGAGLEEASDDAEDDSQETSGEEEEVLLDKEFCEREIEAAELAVVSTKEDLETATEEREEAEAAVEEHQEKLDEVSKKTFSKKEKERAVSALADCRERLDAAEEEEDALGELLKTAKLRTREAKRLHALAVKQEADRVQRHKEERKRLAELAAEEERKRLDEIERERLEREHRMQVSTRALALGACGLQLY